MENNMCMSRSCCFTGHRIIPQALKVQIYSALKNEIITAITNGYTNFLAGGALGFDTMAAQAVLELKQEYGNIKLILVLPCITQTKGWQKSDIDEYERIKSIADDTIYTSQEYYKGCMQKRNRHLVDNSSLCICYLTEKNGGTAYTVKYSESKGVRVINIAKQLQH